MYDQKTCEAKLNTWLDAEDKIAVGGQSYEVEGRKLTRADLKEVRKQIELWEARLARSKGGQGVVLGKAIIW